MEDFGGFIAGKPMPAHQFLRGRSCQSLTASGDTDPNDAFRYWWLFFRTEGFSQSLRGSPRGLILSCRDAENTPSDWANV